MKPSPRSEPIVPSRVSEEALAARCAALETELRNVRELSEAVYRGLSIGVFLVQVEPGGEFRSLGFNQVLERAIGVSSSECMGKRPIDLVPHVLSMEHARFMTEKYQLCVERRETIEYEQYLEFYNKPSWWLTRLSPVMDASGKVVRIVGSCWDDSTRKRLELENEERQRRFRAVFECSFEPKLLFDDSGRIIDCNAAAAQMLGYSYPELLQINVGEVLSGATKSTAEILEQFASAGGHCEELRVRGKDGRTVWVECEGMANIMPGVHLSVCRDLSARKAAEETVRSAQQALESSHARLDAMTEAIPHPIAAFSADTRVAVCNSSFRKMFQKLYGKRVNVGDSVASLTSGVRADVELQRALIDRAFSGETFSLLAEFGDPALGRRIYQVSLAPMRSSAGDVNTVAFTALDFTERSHFETELRASEARFRDLAANLPGVIFEWVVGADGTNAPVYLSPRANELLGVDGDKPTELLLRLSEEDRTRLLASAAEAAHRAQVWMFDAQVRDAQGQAHWMRGVARPADLSPDRTVYNGVLIDDTERRGAAHQLEMAATVFEASRDGILILDAFGTVLRVNHAFGVLTGISPADIVGRQPHALLAEGHDVSFVDRLWERTLTDNHWYGEMTIRRADGTQFAAEVHCRTVRGAQDRVQNFVFFIADVSERKSNEARIRNLAQHDHLTGLPNRALLEDRLRQAISHADRTHTRLAMLFVDLDHFKAVNDDYGHATGDLLLVQVASRLTGCVRVADTVSRQGGDEFVVLITDLESTAAAARIAEKILDVLAEPFAVNGVSLSITASIGIATFPDDCSGVEDLFKHADAAMYHAKNEGRNGYQFFTEDMNTRAHERAAAEVRVRRALKGKEFSLHYHPRVGLGDDTVVAIEALVRWNDVESGAVQPDVLVSLADSCGLGAVLGESVLNEACRQLRQWQRAGVINVPVAVNVSAEQFRDKDFLASVRTALHRSGLAPSHLCLEVPEATLMRDVEFSRMVLSELNALGVAVSVDQFGGGFTSASALSRLPIRGAQLDRALIVDAPQNTEHASVASAVTSMMHALGVKTVAINIESEAQAQFARKLGCAQAQGFLFAKPMPPYECERWLKASLQATVKH